ncbi:unnamed protein product [Brachionus calyciflorus]|uniref:Uncharacterized protein n=1 Tax=Brachionus calyciflorus TaxID=104777 RepID=A0A814MLH3_9BILA|nr:unnamed protein product [Brachionus calyciflorus]
MIVDENSDEDFSFASVPTFRDKEEDQFLPAQNEKKNTEKTDQIFQKIIKENVNFISNSSNFFRFDETAFEFEINSIVKDNENLKAIVKKQTESLESLNSELEKVKDEAFDLSFKLKQSKEQYLTTQKEILILKEKDAESKNDLELKKLAIKMTQTDFESEINIDLTFKKRN